MQGADILVQTLAKAGVRRIFSLSGNQIMPVFDACIDVGIEIVHTRHEAAALFMADAFAQLTGQVGVALVTAAPGFANALGPLYSARASESPVLLLSGAAPIAQDGMGAFQELAQAEMAVPVTKLSFRAASGATLASDTKSALRTALRPSGARAPGAAVRRARGKGAARPSSRGHPAARADGRVRGRSCGDPGGARRRAAAIDPDRPGAERNPGGRDPGTPCGGRRCTRRADGEPARPERSLAWRLFLRARKGGPDRLPRQGGRLHPRLRGAGGMRRGLRMASRERRRGGTRWGAPQSRPA